MKKLLLDLRISDFFLFILLLPLSSFATKFQVLKIKGEAFGVSKAGITKSLKSGEFLYFGDEVILEESSKITLLGPKDLVINLSKGAHLKFQFDEMVLKRGDVWLQNQNSQNSVFLETTNSRLRLDKGDLIVNYSDSLEKTSAFVLNGYAVLSNIFDKYKIVSLRDGEFTYLTQKKNEGRPRMATVIGKESFIELKKNFPSIQPLVKGGIFETMSLAKKEKGIKSFNREIASMAESVTSSLDKKSITFISAENKKKWSQRKAMRSISSIQNRKPSSVSLRFIKRNSVVKESHNQKVVTSKKEDIVSTPAKEVESSGRKPAKVFVDESNLYEKPMVEKSLAKPAKKKTASNPMDSFLNQLENVQDSNTEVY